jgi:[ribosomal protein S5]-alanine N-acetyltransferase
VYPVKLHGARVTLREFEREDVDASLALVGDDRVTYWLSFDSRSREQAAKMIEGVIERAQVEPRTEYSLQEYSTTTLWSASRGSGSRA